MPSPRILIVDDEPHVRNVVRMKLEAAGYEVTVAIDGEDAFELALLVTPDLLITDLQMPRMTGFELCMKLRTVPALADIPAIMLTSRGDILSDAERIAAGIVHIVDKPFSPRHLIMMVGAIKPVTGDHRAEPTLSTSTPNT